MDPTKEEIVAQVVVNEMRFIAARCAQIGTNADNCRESDVFEILGAVSRIFMGLMFAKLKHLRAQPFYDALTEEFQKVGPPLFGMPSRRFIFDLLSRRRKASDDLLLTSIREFEKRLYDQSTGEVYDASIWGVFTQINRSKATNEAAAVFFNAGPCDAEAITKALIDHYEKTCLAIEMMMQEPQND